MTASARGLFRATGNSAKLVPVQLLDGSFTKGEAEREADDFYPTPPEPTRALLAAEIERLRDFPTIWEPAAGDGAMAREMRSIGLSVLTSDLIDRGCGAEIRSFYDFEAAPSQALITNPPFAECNKDPGWVRHALERLGVEYMALLLPVNWVGASGRVMRWRIDFTGQGAPPMLNAWFVWDKQHQGETVLRMLDRADARQSEMFGAVA